MFKLFSNKPPECPIDEPTRIWLENAFIWLVHQFGEDKIKSKRILYPSVEYFPIRYDGSKESLLYTAAIVAKQMDVNINDINIEIYREGIHAVQGSRLFTQAAENSKLSSGKYFGRNENNKYDVFIEENNLDHPEKMVATLAHEFAHIKLLGEERLADNDEHLTDLATVLFGIGVFNANSSFKEFSTTNTSGHYRLGYLRQQEWGYALALYAYYREEKMPQWAKHLSPNIQSDFKKSHEYIYANTDKIFQEEYKEPSKKESDDFYTGNWVGQYTYGKGYSAKQRRNHIPFTIQMQLTDGVLHGTCIEDGLANTFDEPAIIDGHIQGDNISFIKTYPSNLVIDKDGKTTAITGKPSQKIIYAGAFIDNEFAGKWEIKSIQQDKDGALYDHLLTGTWTMKKQ